MKKNVIKGLMLSASILVLGFSSCSDNDGPDGPDPIESAGFVTVAGAVFQTEPGDGNGGTMVYSLSEEDARNPDVSVNVFDDGFAVKSSRTARLQASADGAFLYNIQYTGADGGVFNKYKVEGGKSFPEVGSPINTSQYVGTSPRWVKIAEGLGAAVDVKVEVTHKGTVPNETINTITSSGRVLVLDLDNPRILNVNEEYFELPPLGEEERAAGYHVFRFDAPVLNRAGNKLYVGTWMRKYDMNVAVTYGSNGNPVYTQDAEAPRLATRTLVLDYPSLENPTFIESANATGDNSGYRSPMAHVAEDGAVYQATHREYAGTGGSKILRIGQNNEYDDTFVLSLDDALGVTDSYIETWRYVGGGIGYVIYSLAGEGGYIARVDLNAKTASKVNLPGEANLDFGQHQGIAVHGDYVYIPVTRIGVEGNIYVFNIHTGEMTVGAKLVNKTGNRYIGAY